MTRLAAVGFCNDSGVGRELVSAIRQLPVNGLFILENPKKPTRLDLLQTSAYVVSRGRSTPRDMDRFLDKYKPDTILTWEGPGSPEFPRLWAMKGIRWVNVVHFDWFNPSLEWGNADLISPNKMCQDMLRDQHQLKSTLLPVPIDTDKFVFRKRTRAEQFISVYGYGGPYGRRSLPEIFLAWSEIASPPPLQIHAQVRPAELARCLPPSQVTVKVENLPEPSDLYRDADVAVQISRYEGIGISFLEAMACGVPVITTKASPMSEIAPELCVLVEQTETVNLAGKELFSFTPSVASLRETVEYLHGRDIGDLSVKVRSRVEKLYSWKALRSRWMEFLA